MLGRLSTFNPNILQPGKRFHCVDLNNDLLQSLAESIKLAENVIFTESEKVASRISEADQVN